MLAVKNLDHQINHLLVRILNRILKYNFTYYRVAPPPPPPPSKKKLLKMTSFVQEDSTPKSSAHVVNWFKKIEAPKGVGKESDGSISIWFHGK